MTRLMSFCTRPIVAQIQAVSAPITVTTASAVSECSNIGESRATMKTPAVTIVAAWINAEIGVGPSIESGSQTWSGIWALLPIAPTKSARQMKVMAGIRHEPKASVHPWARKAGIASNTSWYSTVPK